MNMLEKPILFHLYFELLFIVSIKELTLENKIQLKAKGTCIKSIDES